MLIIGLCGGSGSGKGAVSEIFASCGYLTVDADKVYHSLISRRSDCTRELSREFGEEIIGADGAVDRKRLAEIVFSDREKLQKLNKISHFYVIGRIREIIGENEGKNYRGAIVDAPVLFESGFDSECDAIVAVIADKDIRIARILLRDSVTAEAAEQRIKNQISDEYLVERANYVIENNGSLSQLASAVRSVIEKIENNNKARI